MACLCTILGKRENLGLRLEISVSIASCIFVNMYLNKVVDTLPLAAGYTFA